MGKSITLSPKHGVNPSIPTCFWCGQPKNEIVLFGRLPGDREAGMNCGPINYEPCNECQNNMALGITLIEATMCPVHDKQAAMSGAYPTGRWLVISKEAAQRIFTSDILPDVLKRGKAFMAQDAFGLLLQPAPDGASAQKP